MQRLRARLPGRPPLVPKELIVPVCQRMAFILFVMCGTALSIRMYTLWKMGRFNSKRINGAGFTPINGTRFFLDISDGEQDGNSQTRLLEELGPTRKLEEHGWKGICAGPNPENERLCQHISQPVAASNGDEVMVSDCSQQTRIQVLTSLVSTINCPKVSKPGVGIEELLRISQAHLQAPNVIDYVFLHTKGSELAILNRFPFDKFCSRAWTISYPHKDAASIHELLENRGCHVKTMSEGCWARCHCDHAAGSLIHTDASHVNADAPKHWKRSQSSHVETLAPHHGALDEEKKPLQRKEVSLFEEAAEETDVDPLAESMRFLGGSGGLGGQLLRKSFA